MNNITKEEKKLLKEEEKKKKKALDDHYKEVIAYQKKNKMLKKVAPKDSFISLQHLNKIYSNHVQAVYDFSLEIKEHEFIVFVGPSGCGKSTTLRMIAGLEDITAGDLYIAGKYANDLEPKDRDVAMVFQSYALYPHMTVYDNLAFGLEVRHVPKEEIKERIYRAAKILQIEDYLDRKPKALSGGQCQRVALGRAIVRNSKVFLMDEPLSNLDAKLRVQMRSEIVALHNELGSTTIYVTHDQTEAMTMATRIVVMKKGYVQQIGTPREIYDHPANTFVATFIGSPAMNILKVKYDHGTIILPNGVKIRLIDQAIKAHDEYYQKKIDTTDDEKTKTIYQEYLTSQCHEILFGIRPEDIYEDKYAAAANLVSEPFGIKIHVAELLGKEYHLHFYISEQELVAKVRYDHDVNSNDALNICFDLESIHLFDDISTEYII